MVLQLLQCVHGNGPLAHVPAHHSTDGRMTQGASSPVSKSSAVSHQRARNSPRDLNSLLSKELGPEQTSQSTYPGRHTNDLEAQGPLPKVSKMHCGSFIVTDVQDVDFCLQHQSGLFCSSLLRLCQETFALYIPRESQRGCLFGAADLLFGSLAKSPCEIQIHSFMDSFLHQTIC